MLHQHRRVAKSTSSESSSEWKIFLVVEWLERLDNPPVQKEAPDSNVRSLQKAKASPRGRGPGQTGKNLGRGPGKTGENFMSEIDRSIRTFCIECSFIS